MSRVLVALVPLSLLLVCESVGAHGGKLDSKGCHHDRKNGGYHCHRSQATTPPKASSAPSNKPPNPKSSPSKRSDASKQESTDAAKQK